MSAFDGKGLAARVSGLIHGQFGGDIVAAARALEADPDELWRVVEEETEYPNIDLLGRIVKRFGVDACWLVTGEYDWRAHMRLLEQEEEGEADPQLLLRLVGRSDVGRRVVRLVRPAAEPRPELSDSA